MANISFVRENPTPEMFNGFWSDVKRGAGKIARKTVNVTADVVKAPFELPAKMVSYAAAPVVSLIPGSSTGVWAAASGGILSSSGTSIVSRMENNLQKITSADLGVSVEAFKQIVSDYNKYVSSYGSKASKDQKIASEMGRVKSVYESARDNLNSAYESYMMYTLNNAVGDPSMFGTLPYDSLQQIIAFLGQQESANNYQLPNELKGSPAQYSVGQKITEYKNAAKSALTAAASRSAVEEAEAQQRSAKTKSTVLLAAGAAVAAYLAFKG